MRREDDALEVRLKDGQLVGWLTDYHAPHCDRIVVRRDFDIAPVTSMTYIMDEEVVIEERVLRTKIWAYELSHLKIAGMTRAEQDFQIQKNTAFYAERQSVSNRDVMQWNWKAAVLDSMEDYEFVFECDCFEPFDDGESDPELKKPVWPARFEADRVWLDESSAISAKAWKSSCLDVPLPLTLGEKIAGVARDHLIELTRKSFLEGSAAYGPTSFTASTTSTPSTSLDMAKIDEMRATLWPPGRTW